MQWLNILLFPKQEILISQRKLFAILFFLGRLPTITIKSVMRQMSFMEPTPPARLWGTTLKIWRLWRTLGTIRLMGWLQWQNCIFRMRVMMFRGVFLGLQTIIRKFLNKVTKRVRGFIQTRGDQILMEITPQIRFQLINSFTITMTSRYALLLETADISLNP